MGLPAGSQHCCPQRICQFDIGLFHGFIFTPVHSCQVNQHIALADKVLELRRRREGGAVGRHNAEFAPQREQVTSQMPADKTVRSGYAYRLNDSLLRSGYDSSSADTSGSSRRRSRTSSCDRRVVLCEW